MKRFLFAILIALVFVQYIYAYNYISWQAQKGEGIYWNYLGVSANDISGVVSCHVRGPNMSDYVPLSWEEGRKQWFGRYFYPSINELQQNSVGTWLLKLVYEDNTESIYEFTLSGTLEDADFPPVPTIIDPKEGASIIVGVIYEFRWNSNGANIDATRLGVEVVGDDYFYSAYDLDLSTTTWNPGWLDIGNAYFRISYMIDHTRDMSSYPTYISGPEINWIKTRAYIASGVKNDFIVKISPDSDTINLSDLAILCAHWLENNCDSENNWCLGVDLDQSGTVDIEDINILSRNWLIGVKP